MYELNIELFRSHFTFYVVFRSSQYRLVYTGFKHIQINIYIEMASPEGKISKINFINKKANEKLLGNF